MEKELLWIIRTDFLKVLYTHVVHEETSKKYLNYVIIYNFLNYILIICLLILLIFQLKFDNNCILYLGIFLTFLDLSIIIFEWIFKLKDKVNQYKNTAIELLELRDDYINLMWLILWEVLNKKEILSRVDFLSKRKNYVYKNALPTSNEEYEKVKDFLDPDKKFRWWWAEIQELEIDYNLPENLRLWKQ